MHEMFHCAKGRVAKLTDMSSEKISRYAISQQTNHFSLMCKFYPPTLGAESEREVFLISTHHNVQNMLLLKLDSFLYRLVIVTNHKMSHKESNRKKSHSRCL